MNICFEKYWKEINRDDLDRYKIEKAFNFGSHHHEGQYRKNSKEPYFTHPIEVSKLLKTKSTDIIIAALLHDVVEDTDVTLDMINDEFGRNVRILVEGMTKTKENDMFHPLSIAANQNKLVILIKLADRLHNLSDGIYDMSEKTQNKYLSETPKLISFAKRFGITEFTSDITQRIQSLDRYLNEK